MPTFTIDLPRENETLYPNPQGQAAVTCTVTNTTPHPVRGKVTIVPREGTPPGWLSLEAADERDFLAAEAQSFSVSVKVPPDASDGDYGFRVNVANVADPNRDFLESKSVAFAWKKPVKVRNPSVPKWLIIAIVAAVVVIGVIVGVVATRKTTPPVVIPQTNPVTAPVTAPADVLMEHLIGRSRAEAEAWLNDHHVPFKTVAEINNQYGVGLVSNQDPAENKSVAGKTVTLFVSSKNDPQVTGFDLGSAASTLMDNGFHPEASGDYHRKLVSTDPPIGLPALPGAQVTMYFPRIYRRYTPVELNEITAELDTARRRIPVGPTTR